MDSYTVAEREVRSNEVRHAIASGRIALQKMVRRNRVVSGLLAILIAGLSVLFYMNLQEQVAFDKQVVTMVSSLTEENAILRQQVNKMELDLARKSASDVPQQIVVQVQPVVIATMTPVPTAIETPFPTATPAPTATPTLSAFEQWCSGGKAEWIPQNPNGVTRIVESDKKLLAQIVGPEVAFDVETDFNPELLGILKSLRERYYREPWANIRWLVSCKSVDKFQPYTLHALSVDGKTVWPAPTATATPRSVQPTTVATATPALKYRSANARTWQVNFQRGYIEDVASREYFEWGTYYQLGDYFVVATCSYGDLEAIKKVLDDNALRGYYLTLEFVHRWGREFVTGIGEGVNPIKYEWQVCPEWFTENGGGFDW